MHVIQLSDIALGARPLGWETQIEIACGATHGSEYLHCKIDPQRSNSIWWRSEANSTMQLNRFEMSVKHDNWEIINILQVKVVQLKQIGHLKCKISNSKISRFKTDIGLTTYEGKR